MPGQICCVLLLLLVLVLLLLLLLLSRFNNNVFTATAEELSTVASRGKQDSHRLRGLGLCLSLGELCCRGLT